MFFKSYKTTEAIDVLLSEPAGTVRQMLGLHAYDIVEVNPTQHTDYLVCPSTYLVPILVYTNFRGCMWEINRLPLYKQSEGEGCMSSTVEEQHKSLKSLRYLMNYS